MDVYPAANEIGGDICLQVGERQDEIGPQREDLVDICRSEGADAWLFAANLRRPHDIARDANDAVLFAEQVQRLDGLFGEADNSIRRKRQILRAPAASNL